MTSRDFYDGLTHVLPHPENTMKRKHVRQTIGLTAETHLSCSAGSWL
jgi:hypothetical protein